MSIDNIMESLEFNRRHPEVGDFEIELLGTYATCLGPNMTEGRTSLETVHHHIFTEVHADGRHGCEWCKETFKVKKKRELYFRSR